MIDTQGDERGTELVAGVDGCRAGWVVVTAPASAASRVAVPTVEVVATFEEVVRRPFAVLAVDMPIGLPSAGSRACDRAARVVVGPRRSSVFPAPVRATLEAVDYPDALRRSRAASGRGLSKQAFFLLPKIAEVDAVVRREGQHRIAEAHPESAFATLAGAYLPPKRTAEGRTARRALLHAALGELDPLLDAPPPRGAAFDDVADAAVLVWTARRLLAGSAVVLGGDPPDAAGLRMEIAY